MIDNFEVKFNEKLSSSHSTYEKFNDLFKQEWKNIASIVNKLNSKMKGIQGY